MNGIDIVSIVSILDNPTIQFELAVCRPNHTVTKPDLSELIIEEDSNIEGEAWHSEVGEWNLSSSECSI